MNNMSEKPPPPQPPPPPLLMQHTLSLPPPPPTSLQPVPDQYQYEPAYVTLGKSSNNNGITMATATPTGAATTTMTMTMTTSPKVDEVSHLLKYQSGMGLTGGIAGVTSSLPDGNVLILSKSMNNASPSTMMGGGTSAVGVGVSVAMGHDMGMSTGVGIGSGTMGASSTGTNKNSARGGSGSGGSGRKAKRKCCSCFGRPSTKKPMSFWTVLITNLGICTLLLAYTLLGSFIFLTIENEDYSLLHHQQRTLASTKRQGSGSSSLPPQRRVDNSSSSTSSISSSNSNSDSISGESSSGLFLNGISDPQSAIEADTYDVRQRTIENIWDITVSLNILYKENWTKLAALEIAKFQDQLIKRLSEDVTLSNLDGNSPATEAVLLLSHAGNGQKYEWNFAKAFLYSLTVLTTIGYGNVAPKTTLGRLVTLAYAILGIPLTLVYLSSTGGVLAKVAREVFSRALCCCLCSNCGYCCYDEKRMAEKERRMKRKRQQEEMRAHQSAMNEPFYVRPGSLHNNFHSPEKQQHVIGGHHNNMLPDVDSLSASESRGSMHGLSILAPILLCLCMMIIYIMFGALVLYRLENWPILDGVYFCFMSLSTIGFGDLMPGLRKESTATTWFCSVYIMSGMALTAMCFNVLHEEIVHRIKVVVEFKKNPTLENDDSTPGYYMPP